MAYDPFRPSSEPARTIYDAFQTEAMKRQGRPVEEWIKAEREVVWATARDAAQNLGLRAPTMAEIESAERYACGSADYGKTWAFRVIEFMHKPSQA